MLKDVGETSGHKKKEEFQEGTEWKSFLKKKARGVFILRMIFTSLLYSIHFCIFHFFYGKVPWTHFLRQ